MGSSMTEHPHQRAHMPSVKTLNGAYEWYQAACSCGWRGFELRYARASAQLDGVEHIEWTRRRA